MTTPLVPSITDEQLADLEKQCEKFSGFAVSSTLVEQLISRLREAERDANNFKAAYMEWHDKTEWVQATAEPRDLGKHRADVIADRFYRLNEELSRFRHRANQPYDDDDIEAMQEHNQ